MIYRAGASTADITAFFPGVGMMGYGNYANRVQEKETPLLVRAFVIEEIASRKRMVFVVADMAFITIAVKDEVILRLKNALPEAGFSMENVMLTAQHTHSGPGGYSHYGLYNFSIPGFMPQVFECIVSGITDAITRAFHQLQPARLRLVSGNFEPNPELAVNRALQAWNRNPEVPKLAQADAHHAVDLEMTLLRIETEDGKLLGAVNWFGVHATSVPNTNTRICWDNKGYAAQMLENEIQSQCNPSFVGAFAQSFAGDISPNYRYSRKEGRMIGISANPFESAKHNGRLQYEKASELLALASRSEILESGMECRHRWSNFACILPETDLTDGKQVRTVPACLGVAFARGAPDGIGLSKGMVVAAKGIAGIIRLFEAVKCWFVPADLRRKIKDKYKYQGKKCLLMEPGARRIWGTRDVKNLILPSFTDPIIRVLKRQHRKGALNRKPWVPQILPLQIFRLGQLAIVGLPAEISTVAGRRLRKTIHDELKNAGITKVIISSLANAYSGYITTAEEYDVQCYEGGHTMFGKWTCAAFQTEFRHLARSLAGTEKHADTEMLLEPVRFSRDELEGRVFG